jgi:tetratricopeptide (TPR) repeat protein
MLQGLFAGLAMCAAGCAPTVQERVHDCNEDGVSLFTRGAYDPARECFQTALCLQPENADLIYNLGQCYQRLGNEQRAEQLYHECLARNPDHAECHHALTLLLLEEGRRQEAVDGVEDWLKRSPENPDALAEDGWLYARGNDPNHAIMRFQDALRYDIHNVRALTELGRVYEEQMHYPDRALSLYQRALQVNPNQPDVIRRVSALRNQGTGPPRPED